MMLSKSETGCSKMLAIAKQYCSHRYTWNDLRAAQQSDLNLVKLKQLIDSDNPDAEELDCDQNIATRAHTYFAKFKTLLFIDREGIINRKRTDTEKIMKKTPLIILPQLFHREVVIEAHDRQGHQGEEKTTRHVQDRYDWPGLHQTVHKYVTACPDCQATKGTKTPRIFPLKNLESGSPNELLQVDNVALSKSPHGYNGALVMIDHFTK